jgi:hypothetical protein
MISSSGLSLLMAVTLFWGGCVACPQFFMFSSRAKKDCCKAGQCDKSQSGKSTGEKVCKLLPLEPHGFGQDLAEPPASIIGSIELALPANTRSPEVPVFIDYSPPDLHVLNSTFLI